MKFLREQLFIGAAVIASVFLLASCGSKGADASKTPDSPPADAQADAKDAGPSFDPDKGLFLPDETRQSMGITTAPVVKKTFQAERVMKFQVFREADEKPLPGMSYRLGFAYASAILPGEADLALGQAGDVMGKGDSSANLFQINSVPDSNQTELLVEIADPKHQFFLSDFCNVRWKSAAVNVAAAVPDSALLKTTEGDFVYMQKNDRFVRTAIKTGATGEGFTEITDGVAAGDIVVTSPVQTLWLTELSLKSGGD